MLFPSNEHILVFFLLLEILNNTPCNPPDTEYQGEIVKKLSFYYFPRNRLELAGL